MQPYDQAWYTQLKKAPSLALLNYLDGDQQQRQRQRNLFEAGIIRNPVPLQLLITMEEISDKRRYLNDFAREVESGRLTTQLDGTPQTLLCAAYLQRIRHELGVLELLEAAQANDMELFRRCSTALYGEPSQAIFGYTLMNIHSRLRQYKSEGSHELKKLAYDLERMLPQPSIHKSELRWVSQSVFEAVRRRTLEKLNYLLGFSVSKSRVGADEIRRVLELALQALGADKWKVVVHDAKTNITVDQGSRLLKVPKDRTLGRGQLAGLVLHEVGTHIARRENAERGKLALLQTGLANYTKGEEGVAIMREQLMTEAQDFTGEDRYLAAGLALGLDGIPRNFGMVYELMRLYFRVHTLERDLGANDLESRALDEAWRICMRLFRGTDFVTPGVCFTKDILYREGNIAIWKLLEKNISAMDYFDVGKYDPTNRDHVTLLKSLKILPETYELPA